MNQHLGQLQIFELQQKNNYLPVKNLPENMFVHVRCVNDTSIDSLKGFKDLSLIL